ncbi:pos9-activating factor fap7 [Moniliophthora roreri]|nr:pos9-activating factor fap7 [Moniliophthora roreri]
MLMEFSAIVPSFQMTGKTCHDIYSVNSPPATQGSKPKQVHLFVLQPTIYQDPKHEDDHGSRTTEFLNLSCNEALPGVKIAASEPTRDLKT